MQSTTETNPLSPTEVERALKKQKELRKEEALEHAFMQINHLLVQAGHAGKSGITLNVGNVLFTEKGVDVTADVINAYKKKKWTVVKVGSAFEFKK